VLGFQSAWRISPECLAAHPRLRYTGRRMRNWECPAMAEAYDQGNIFAKILRSEIPSHRVYED